MWIHFRKIANFGALSKIEKYIKNKNPKPYSVSKFMIFYKSQKTNMKILQILYHLQNSHIGFHSAFMDLKYSIFSKYSVH